MTHADDLTSLTTPLEEADTTLFDSDVLGWIASGFDDNLIVS